jgi:hypothetical protein
MAKGRSLTDILIHVITVAAAYETQNHKCYHHAAQRTNAFWVVLDIPLGPGDIT